MDGADHAAAPGREGRVTPLWLVVVAVVVAVALRAWILSSPVGRADGDEAVVGLMARAFLDGDLSVFFWGQSYGGVIEPALASLVFAVAGTSTVALKIVPVLLSFVAALLVWRIGKRTVGEPSASTAGLLFLVYPPAFLWWSTKERGFYWVALVLVLGVLLAALRIRDAAPDPRRSDVAALGLLAGIAWYTTPQSAYVVAPVLGWIAVRHSALWKKALPALPAAFLGALPWIAWNVRHGLRSLQEVDPWVHSTYAGRLDGFFTTLLPTLLGARHAYSGDWLLGPVGPLLTGAAVAGLGVLVLRAVRDREERLRIEPLLAVAAAFPFLFALPKASYYVVEPRYGMLLAPVVALLVSTLVVTRARQLVALVLAVALGLVTTASLLRFSRDNPMYVDLTPPRLEPLVEVLDEAGVDRVYADYWIAYPLTFETRERIIGTPVDAVRSLRLRRMVDDADRSVYVLLADSPSDGSTGAALRDRGIPFDRREVGVFAVYFLDSPVTPDMLSGPPGG